MATDDVIARVSALEARVAMLEGRVCQDKSRNRALVMCAIEDLLELDWPALSGFFAAIGHPVRMLLLKEILAGARSTSDLKGNTAFGTTGQIYHHLNHLVASGWVQAIGQRQYAVPEARLAPLRKLLATVAPLAK